MLSFLPVYGDTEGPLGYPMRDAEAKALDALLDTLPEVDYRRLAVFKGASPDLIPGERADIAWITTAMFIVSATERAWVLQLRLTAHHPGDWTGTA